MSCPANFPTNPKLVWANFYELSQIPHPSRHEAALREHIIAKAQKLGCTCKTDAKGNLVVRVPASAGKENAAPVIIQAHLDMVADQLPGRGFDFMHDPLVLKVENGQVMADGTTLGADDGIGVAAALAVMEDSSLVHPPLELLFTVEEEIGLYGALAFDPSLLQGRRMINLDMEEWGSLYIGCAGSIQYFLQKEVKWQKAKQGLTPYRLTLAGLAGGHSGTEIHLGRANAIKLIAELLRAAQKAKLSFAIAALQGGTAHNVIPRGGQVDLMINARQASKWLAVVGQKMEQWHNFLGEADQGLKIDFTPLEDESHRSLRAAPKNARGKKTARKNLVLAPASQQDLLTFLTLMPTGAYDYAWPPEGAVVNLSSNLAVVNLAAKCWQVTTSLRFLEAAQGEIWEEQIRVLAQTLGVKVKRNPGYPSWKPLFNGPLLKVATDCYTRLFKTKPQIKVIHAGLECGIFKSKISDMDMISLGPSMVGVHSPREALDIVSVGQMWQLLAALLAAL